MGRFVGFAEVVDLDDVGMAQPGHGAGLAHETLAKGWMICVLRLQGLDGDLAPQSLIYGKKHPAHSAGSDLAENPVAGEPADG